MNDYENNNSPKKEFTPLDDRELGKTKNTFSLIGFSMLVPLVLVLGIQLLATFCCPAFKPDSQFHQSLLSALLYLVVIPCGMLILRKAEKSAAPAGDGKGFMTFFTCLCIAVQFSVIGYFFGSSLEYLFAGGEAEAIAPETALFPDTLVYLLLTLLVAPVIEELFFRRMLCDVLKKWGWRAAILMSALLYALFHANIAQFFYSFGLGLVLSYAYLKTGKLRYPLIIHIVFNLLFTALPMIVETQICDSETMFAFSDKLENLMNSADMLTYQTEAMKLFSENIPAVVGSLILSLISSLTLGLSFAGAILLFFRRRRITFSDGEKKLPRKYIGDTVFLAPGILLFILASIIITVISLKL